jgi:D-alanyl-D-alanine carboxypeptidase
METPLSPHTPNEIIQTASESFLFGRIGFLCLGLIFVASALFTVSYLQSTRASAADLHIGQTTMTVVPPHGRVDAFASTTLSARAAYVLDLTDNRVLYSLNADTQLPLASITKVAMALAISEVLPLDMQITIPYDTAPAGSSERLARGDIWTVSDVTDFTLVASSNDGAEILAHAADDMLHTKYPSSPEGSATLWRMNNLAQTLHLTKTYFLNVSGLDESPTQAGAYGSAHDVALLFAYAASTSPEIFSATTHASFALLSVNGARTIAINTDKVLDSIPGIVMGKTGYTDLAGGNLAVVFNISGHRIVAVVLGSTEQGRFDDMKKLVTATQKTLAQNPTQTPGRKSRP